MIDDDKIHLDVPAYRQETDYTCVPSCCRMTLDYANELLLTEPEPRLDEDEICKIMRTNVMGTKFPNIENVNTLLVNSNPSIEFISEFEPHTLLGIKKELELGLPLSVWIIINMDGHDYSHSVVITGIDNEAKTISYNDPTYGEEYTISQSKFMDMWELNGSMMIKTKIGGVNRETLEKYMDLEINNE